MSDAAHASYLESYGNSSGEVTSAAHVYVFNRDDDRLRISLFIDSILIDSLEVSSESEAEFGTYYLNKGEHRFTITWWDDDTRKSYETSATATVEHDMPVVLYTEKNDAPDKFYLTVLVKNENDKDLDVCLYIDDKFERCTIAKKSSMTEADKIKLERGMHNISVRWKDPETEIEYRKIRRVDLTGDDAVVIYAPKGVSLKKELSHSKAQKPENSIESSKTSQSSTKKDPAGNASDNRTDNRSLNTAPKTGEVSDLRTPKQAAERIAEEPHHILNEQMYLYAFIISLAVYLLFRS
ncbi:MAG: hypothetical protein N3G75_06390 [Methanothrix sp.]|nr:hypothetical protein [Methanothrix sp.]MCX8207444.1 hypothetical protein [Methanothrix sp.]